MRLDKDLLKKIDEFISEHPYYSRTLIVNRLLTALFNDKDGTAVWGLMGDYDPDTDEIEIGYRISDYKS